MKSQDTIIHTAKTCGCVLDADGKLVERKDGCPIDHVPAGTDTSDAAKLQELTLDQVVSRCEMTASTMSKKNPAKALLLNCASGFRQLANTITTLADENARLRAALEATKNDPAKRLIVP